jgi:hypothetical protein
MLSSTGLAISVARRLGSSIRAEQRIGLVESLAREIGPGDERLEEVRASSVIAKCGAWSWLLPPNTGPGFSETKWKLPSASLPHRTQPRNFPLAGGSACHSSTQASETGFPSPSVVVPMNRILSPSAPKRVRSAQSFSSMMFQKGPMVWLLVALGVSGVPHLRTGSLPARAARRRSGSRGRTRAGSPRDRSGR